MASKFPMDFTNFEIEITNRCNLACPRCSRTDMIDQYPRFWKDADLDLGNFDDFIRPVLGDIETFEFKGTMGDPIFHPDFLAWVSWCKDHGKRIKIHTNAQAGIKLWIKLAELLTPDDSVIIGIDGLPHNFMRYRINARWSNIEDCAKSLKGHTHLVWQFIVFSYNHGDIQEANELALTMGFDDFLLVQSDRWLDGDDWLRPNQSSLPRKTIENLLDPDCFKRSMHIVTADGHYMPCCYLIDHRWRYKTPWAKSFDIRNCTMDDVIRSSLSQEFFAKLTDEAAPDYCRFQCGKCDGK